MITFRGRPVVLALALAASLACGTGGPNPTPDAGSATDAGCSADNCASGCCAINGYCIQNATTKTACGTGGATCQVCSGSQTCTNGQCQ